MRFGANPLFNARTRPAGTAAQPATAVPMLVLPPPADVVAVPWMDQYLVRGVKNRFLVYGSSGVALLLVVLYFMRKRSKK